MVLTDDTNNGFAFNFSIDVHGLAGVLSFVFVAHIGNHQLVASLVGAGPHDLDAIGLCPRYYLFAFAVTGCNRY